MAKYTYICPHDGQEETVRSFKLPSQPPLCKLCGSKMERSYSAPSTVLKGATEANNYYTSPTNADLGMDSELTVMKNATKRAEEYLQTQDRDEKLDFDRDKQKREAQRKKSIESVKKKMPDFYRKFQEGLSKSKKKMKEKAWEKF